MIVKFKVSLDLDKDKVNQIQENSWILVNWIHCEMCSIDWSCTKCQSPKAQINYKINELI
jgi:hypothetical protein